ncbi:hypothetical protein COOONC_01335 [Cooperia oncophora]
MSSMELLKSIIDVNQESTIGSMLIAQTQKMQFSDFLESEEWDRSSVIAGLKEAQDNLRSSKRQTDLKHKMNKVLKILDVECPPNEIYRMGKSDSDRPRSPVHGHFSNISKDQCFPYDEFLLCYMRHGIATLQASLRGAPAADADVEERFRVGATPTKGQHFSTKSRSSILFVVDETKSVGDNGLQLMPTFQKDGHGNDAPESLPAAH